ncbi:MAG: hypothetical protein U5R31_09505 [Acidimicrobiia bacterium]|nr:hypothetical protein [Acidimicrobiia bacterium]
MSERAIRYRSRSCSPTSMRCSRSMTRTPVLVLVTVFDDAVEDDFDHEKAARVNARLHERADVVVDWDAAVENDPNAYFEGGRGVHPHDAGQRALASLVRDGVEACG